MSAAAAQPAPTLADLLAMTGCRDRADLEDMANVGKSLLEAIAAIRFEGSPFQHWMPADGPAEIVTDLFNALVEDRAALAVVRESLTDQAAARLDPTMPLLVPEVVARLREDSEASYALAETQQERIAAHSLSLLCDWQDRARESPRMSETVTRPAGPAPVAPDLSRAVTPAEARAIRAASGLSIERFAEELGAGLPAVVAVLLNGNDAPRQLSLAMRYVGLVGPTRTQPDCADCGGSGTVREAAGPGGNRQHARRLPCPACDGRGRVEPATDRVIA